MTELSCSHNVAANENCWDCIWFLEQEAKRRFPRKKKEVKEEKKEVVEDPKDLTESLIALEKEQKDEQDVEDLVNLYEEMTQKEQDEYDAIVAYYIKREEEEAAEQAILDAEFLYERTHCASCYKEMEMTENGSRPVCSSQCHADLELERRMSYDKYRKY
jgi:NADH pyrophosphatase NudC (nudix superfamily)